MFRSTVSLFVALSIALGSVAPAYGASEDQEIAKAIADSAAQSAVRSLGEDAVADLIDKSLNTATEKVTEEVTKAIADEAAKESSEMTVGQEAVAWIKLGLSVKDFIEADTDKERAYAAADATVAYLAIAFPPAGAIAGVVLLVVKLVDMGITHKQGKELMRIMKRTAEAVRATIELKRQMAKSDAVRLQGIQRSLKESMDDLKSYQKELEEKCDAKKIDIFNLELLRDCQLLAYRVFPKMRNYLDSSEQLIGFESEYFTVAALLKAHGEDPKKYYDSLKNTRALMESTLKESDRMLKAAGKSVGEAVVRMAINRGSLDPVVGMRARCFREATKRARSLSFAMLPKNGDTKSDRTARMASAYAEGNDLMDGICEELMLPENDPLTKQMFVWAKAKRAIENQLFAQ